MREGTIFGLPATFHDVVRASDGRILEQCASVKLETLPDDLIYARVDLRFDDNCLNGHETFSITSTFKYL